MAACSVAGGRQDEHKKPRHHSYMLAWRADEVSFLDVTSQQFGICFYVYIMSLFSVM
jgi:hypothetical protein